MLVVKVMHSIPRNKTNQNLNAEKEPRMFQEKVLTIRASSSSIQEYEVIT